MPPPGGGRRCPADGSTRVASRNAIWESIRADCVLLERAEIAREAIENASPGTIFTGAISLVKADPDNQPVSANIPKSIMAHFDKFATSEFAQKYLLRPDCGLV